MKSLNMFNQIVMRELGLENPRKVVELKKTKRVCSLQLSPEKTFEDVHTGGINSLSLSPDINGKKFLLSAASRGTIAIHALNARDGETCNVLAKIDQSSPYMHKLNVETVTWYPHDSGIFLSR